MNILIWKSYDSIELTDKEMEYYLNTGILPDD